MAVRVRSSRRQFLLASLAASASAATVLGPGTRTPAAGSEKRSFDARSAMRFVNMPDFSGLGLREARIVYASEMWPKAASRATPDLGYIERRTAPKVKAKNPDLVIIDIEHWPLSGSDDSEVEGNIDRYVSVIGAFRRHLPNAKLGLYGMVPIRNYWTPVKGDVAGVHAWNQDNARLQRLADAVDIVYPSLYTFYDDRAGWTRYAEANLAEARQYGKPVYAFLWAQYHKSHKPIDAEFWRMQLDTVFKLADGMVIWSPARGRPRWNPEAAWWLSTVDFLEEIAQG